MEILNYFIGTKDCLFEGNIKNYDEIEDFVGGRKD